MTNSSSALPSPWLRTFPAPLAKPHAPLSNAPSLAWKIHAPSDDLPSRGALPPRDVRVQQVHVVPLLCCVGPSPYLPPVQQLTLNLHIALVHSCLCAEAINSPLQFARRN